MEFRGEKYLNTFIVTNTNDLPNLLSYGATFRMGVLLPNYPQEIVMKGDNVPHFSKMNGGKTGNGTLNGMPNGTSNGISYVNTGNHTASGTLANPVHVNALPVQNTSQSEPPALGAHVHKLPQQVSLALRKVQHPHNGRTWVNRLPLTKQDILSHYSGCFEGIGHCPGDLYKFHLKPEHKSARHTLRKVPIHIEDAFKEEIKSLV